MITHQPGKEKLSGRASGFAVFSERTTFIQMPPTGAGELGASPASSFYSKSPSASTSSLGWWKGWQWQQPLGRTLRMCGWELHILLLTLWWRVPVCMCVPACVTERQTDRQKQRQRHRDRWKHPKLDYDWWLALLQKRWDFSELYILNPLIWGCGTPPLSCRPSFTYNMYI